MASRRRRRAELRLPPDGSILGRIVRHRSALALILALTFAQRLFLSAFAFDLPFDSGSVGLMALHILEGERPLFLYGFHYSGALLSYLVALVFGALGVSLWTFILPTALLTVGWAFVTYRLFRELFPPQVGLAAALCVALPDWITSWYTAVPDCSYSPLFFLGSLVLWLSVRLARRDVTPAAEWVHILALGLGAGLVLWTHPLGAAYLLPAALVLLPWLVRRRFAPGLLLKFLAGGVLMVTALLPYLLEASPAGSDHAGWQWEGAVIRLNATMLATRLLPEMFIWPGLGGEAANRLVFALLALGGGVYLLRLFTASSLRDAAAVALPAMFCAAFLVLYLPSGKAIELAPRYVIALWTMVLFAMAAVPTSARFRWLRWAGGLVLGLWAAYNITGVITYTLEKQPRAASRRAAYDRLVEHAGKAGVDHVMMIGEYFFEAAGQSATFVARDRIRFVGADLERYAPAVGTAETSTAVGFAVETERAHTVREALRMAGARCEETSDAWVHLFHDIRPPAPACGTVPPSELSVTLRDTLYGSPGALTDRTRETYAIGKGAGSGFDLDLGTIRRVEGMALSPMTPGSHLLPESFVLEGSVDGMAFRELLRVHQAEPMCYRAGEAMYFRGSYGWQACRFAPEEIRYLRFTAAGSAEAPTMWRINEVVVYACPDGQHPGEAADAGPVIRRIREHGVSFTVCDRWLSARLTEALPGEEGAWPAFPRVNDHAHLVESGPREPRRTFAPSPRGAVAVAAALADEQEAILGGACRGSGLELRREDLGHYTLFLFEGPAGASGASLEWNGLLLLR